jgi:excisionase family DNA binding protein
MAQEDAATHQEAAGSGRWPNVDPALCLVSRKKASAILGICVDTVDNHVKAGTIRSVKLGGRRLIPVSELERIANGQL